MVRNFGELKGTVQVNTELLHRAFDNLYSNLLKYADPARPVEITCRREGDHLRLEIKNRVPHCQERKESTNIGLATCRRVLQYHGGSFQAEEENGWFHAMVILPLADADV